MIALFDSGSTRLHFSWWDGGIVKNVTDIPYPGSPVELKDVVFNLLGETTPEKAVACSVSGKWAKPLFEAVSAAVPGKLFVARTASDLGITVMYDNPETYGIDRALAAHAAFQMFHDACVVVDAGTAVTIDAINREGAVIGGYIFPGNDIMAFALSSQTDLPLVTVDNISDGIGNSTVTGITYGISMGFSAAVNHLINHAMKIAETETSVVITGGRAENLKLSPAVSAVYKPYLVLEALGNVADILPGYK